MSSNTSNTVYTINHGLEPRFNAIDCLNLASFQPSYIGPHVNSNTFEAAYFSQNPMTSNTPHIVDIPHWNTDSKFYSSNVHVSYMGGLFNCANAAMGGLIVQRDIISNGQLNNERVVTKRLDVIQTNDSPYEFINHSTLRVEGDMFGTTSLTVNENVNCQNITCGSIYPYIADGLVSRDMYRPSSNINVISIAPAYIPNCSGSVVVTYGSNSYGTLIDCFSSNHTLGSNGGSIVLSNVSASNCLTHWKSGSEMRLIDATINWIADNIYKGAPEDGITFLDTTSSIDHAKIINEPLNISRFTNDSGYIKPVGGVTQIDKLAVGWPSGITPTYADGQTRKLDVLGQAKFSSNVDVSGVITGNGAGLTNIPYYSLTGLYDKAILLGGSNGYPVSSTALRLDYTVSPGILYTPNVSVTNNLTVNGLITSSNSSGFIGIGSNLTNFTSTQITNALGFSPYNSTNPNGYISSSSITSNYLRLDGGLMTGALSNTGTITTTNTGGFYGVGSNITNFTSSQITNALGYTPYNGTTNSSNYITSNSVSMSYLPLSGGIMTGAISSPSNITLTGIGKFVGDGSSLTNLPLSSYLTTTTASNTYLAKAGGNMTGALSNTGTITTTNTSGFYGVGSNLTNFTSNQITNALGYTPYNSLNPSNYITSSNVAANYLPLNGGTLVNPLTVYSGTYDTVLILDNKAFTHDCSMELRTRNNYTPKILFTQSYYDSVLGFGTSNTSSANISLQANNQIKVAGSFYCDGVISGNGSGLSNIPYSSITGTPSLTFLPLGGGTMSGAISSPSNITLTGTGKFVGDGSSLSNLPLSSYLTSATAATTYLPLAGGNMTGDISTPGSIDILLNTQTLPPNNNFTTNSLTIVGLAGAAAELTGTYTISASSQFNTTTAASFQGFATGTSGWASSNVANDWYDNIGGSYNATATASTTVDGVATKGEWLQMQFPNPMCVSSFTIRSPNLTTNYIMPKDVVIAASNDGTTWTSVYSNTLSYASYTVNKDFTFSFTATTSAYNRLRFIVKSIIGNAANTNKYVQFTYLRYSGYLYRQYLTCAGDATISGTLTVGDIVGDGSGLSNLPLSNYLTTSNASTTYLTQSNATLNYLTISNASTTYLTQSNATSNYLAITDASTNYLTQANATSNYLSISTASNTYLPKAGGTMTGALTCSAGITGYDTALSTSNAFRLKTTPITSAEITTALTFTPYNATNPNSYISTTTSSNSFLLKTGGTMTGALTSTSFSGAGSNITFLNATNISSGTINAARLPALYASNCPYTGLTGSVPIWNQDTTGSSASCTGNAATATTATDLSGGSVSATTITSSGDLSVGGTISGAALNVTSFIKTNSSSNYIDNGCEFISNDGYVPYFTFAKKTMGGVITSTGTLQLSRGNASSNINQMQLWADKGLELRGSNVNLVIGKDVTSGSGLALDVSGNAKIFGTFTAVNNTSLTGTLGVSGATTLSSTLGVTGAVTCSSSLTAGSTIVTDLQCTSILPTYNSYSLSGNSINIWMHPDQFAGCSYAEVEMSFFTTSGNSAKLQLKQIIGTSTNWVNRTLGVPGTYAITPYSTLGTFQSADFPAGGTPDYGSINPFANYGMWNLNVKVYKNPAIPALYSGRTLLEWKCALTETTYNKVLGKAGYATGDPQGNISSSAINVGFQLYFDTGSGISNGEYSIMYHK